jgi:hypothetical protein
MPAPGIFKRLKVFAPKVMDVINTVNKYYKQAEPYLSTVLDSVPYGSVIKQGAKTISKGIDSVNTIANKIQQNKKGYSSNPKNNLIFGEPINKVNYLQKPLVDEEEYDDEIIDEF